MAPTGNNRKSRLNRMSQISDQQMTLSTMPKSPLRRSIQDNYQPIVVDLLPRARLQLAFVVWNQYQTSDQKVNLVYKVIKCHQECQKKRGLKLRRQYDLTRDALKLLMYLSTLFLSEITSLARDAMQVRKNWSEGFQDKSVKKSKDGGKKEMLDFLELL